MQIKDPLFEIPPDSLSVTGYCLLRFFSLKAVRLRRSQETAWRWPMSWGWHYIGYMGLNSAATIHLMAEAMKRAYADRPGLKIIILDLLPA